MYHMMKKCISLFLTAVLPCVVLFCARQSLEVPILTEENVEKACENVLCTAVRIQGSHCYGSGSIFEIKKDEIIIVTNAHMTASMDEDSYVTFFNGAECKSSIIGSSSKADIGFLRVLSSELTKEEKKQLKSVGRRREAYEKLEINDDFFMIDMASDSKNPVRYMGTVVDKGRFLPDYNREMLYGDGMAVPGMSGSGIFDYYGNYIGTLSGATLHYELAGVPLDAVLEEYENCFKN